MRRVPKKLVNLEISTSCHFIAAVGNIITILDTFCSPKLTTYLAERRDADVCFVNFTAKQNLFWLEPATGIVIFNTLHLSNFYTFERNAISKGYTEDLVVNSRRCACQKSTTWFLHLL